MNNNKTKPALSDLLANVQVQRIETTHSNRGGKAPFYFIGWGRDGLLEGDPLSREELEVLHTLIGRALEGGMCGTAATEEMTIEKTTEYRNRGCTERFQQTECRAEFARVVPLQEKVQEMERFTIRIDGREPIEMPAAPFYSLTKEARFVCLPHPKNSSLLFGPIESVLKELTTE